MCFVTIAHTFIQSNVPNELHEAASIDGCSDTRYFFKMALPLSKAAIAADVLNYSLIVVATVPILCVCLFTQKYFTKGAMIGSIKG